MVLSTLKKFIKKLNSMVSTIQILVFILTFLSYAAYHCSRTYWAYIQDSMHTDINGYDKNYTGYVNLAFLFIYSVFMIMYEYNDIFYILELGQWEENGISLIYLELDR